MRWCTYLFFLPFKQFFSFSQTIFFLCFLVFTCPNIHNIFFFCATIQKRILFIRNCFFFLSNIALHKTNIYTKHKNTKKNEERKTPEENRRKCVAYTLCAIDRNRCDVSTNEKSAKRYRKNILC